MRVRSTEVSARTIGDETIVLHLTGSRYFSITGVGSRVFQLLTQERTLDELVDVIVDEYDIDATTARRDIDAFLGKLRDARLLC